MHGGHSSPKERRWGDSVTLKTDKDKEWLLWRAAEAEHGPIKEQGYLFYRCGKPDPQNDAKPYSLDALRTISPMKK